MKAKTHFFYFLLLIFFLQTVLVSTATAATRIMPLGDSITQGSSSGVIDEDRQVSYRKALWDKLLSAGYDIDFVGSLNSGSTIFGDLDPADHEGHNSWTDDDIAANIYDWLDTNPTDIILLHIGTNDLNSSADDVALILDNIDQYETDYTTEITVILARIINRACCEEVPPCPECATTTTFNNNVEAMAQARMPGDKIKIVDMEDGAGIDYDMRPAGDMFDLLHPYQYGAGYDKMADVWYSALVQILPDPDPPDNPSSSDDSGCFISTATYGSDMEPHIKAPGEFRDYFLHNTFVGRTFVALYNSIRHLRLISTLDVFIK